MKRMNFDAAAIIGMASLWPLLQSSTYFPFNLMQNSGSIALGSLAPWHELYSAILIVLGIILILVDVRVDIAKHAGKALLLVLAIFGTAGEVVLFLADGASGLISVMLSVGSLLVAAFILGAICIWGARTIRSEARESVMLIALSYIAAEAVLTVCSLIGLNVQWVLLACPLISMVCACLSSACPAGERPAIGSLRGIPWRMMLPSVLLVYFGVIFVRILIGYQIGGLSDFDRAVTTIIPFIVFSFVVFYVSRNPSAADDLTITFSALVVVYMAALTMVLIFGDANYTFVKRVVVASEHCFEVFVWILVATTLGCREKGSSVPFALYAIVIVALPSFLSFDVMQMGGVLDLVSNRAFAIPLAAVVSFATASASIVYLVIATLRKGADVKMSEDDWRERVCREALGGLDLSEREMQVAVLLYRGYTAKRIADSLYVSESTVKTHISHIYSKIGIHSKQEFITHIDRLRDESSI